MSAWTLRFTSSSKKRVLRSFLLFLLLSAFLLGLILHSLGGTLGLCTLVEIERAVLGSDWEQKVSTGELLDEGTSQGSADLELFAKNGSGHAKDLGNLLEHSLELLLIEEDGVVKLILDLDFSPRLLLSLGSFTSCCFLFRHLCTFGCAFRRILTTYLCLFSL